MPVKMLASSLTDAAGQTAIDPLTVRLLVVALAATVSAFVALVAAVLAKVAGAHVATAALRGGAAFAGTLVLGIAVLTALGVL